MFISNHLICWLALKNYAKRSFSRLKMLVIMFVIRFLDITRKSRNFHAFTYACLAHAQTNFPAAFIVVCYDGRELHVTIAVVACTQIVILYFNSFVISFIMIYKLSAKLQNRGAKEQFNQGRTGNFPVSLWASQPLNKTQT